MITDLRGVGRLAVDAVSSVTDIAEALHAAIGSLSPVVGPPGPNRTAGISGWVYRGVRGVTRGVGFGVDALLAPLAANPTPAQLSTRREALLAALNGVLGDHLEATANPLAIPMRFRQAGATLDLRRSALRRTLSTPGTRPLVLVHGLCMNDLQWRRGGHDHGAALSQALGYTPVYLHYNTGRSIQANGAEFSARLQELVDAWPSRIDELTILGHSMGGLVTHAACQQAEAAGHDWTGLPGKRIFLGTPHQGAPLERAGEWFNATLGRSPYLSPFQRLGNLRSAGIKDLREGLDIAAATALAASTDRLHLVAAVRRPEPAAGGRLRGGDGLVPLESALALEDERAPGLDLPDARRHVAWGTSHLDLLSSADVHARLNDWLAR